MTNKLNIEFETVSRTIAPNTDNERTVETLGNVSATMDGEPINVSADLRKAISDAVGLESVRGKAPGQTLANGQIPTVFAVAADRTTLSDFRRENKAFGEAALAVRNGFRDSKGRALNLADASAVAAILSPVEGMSRDYLDSLLDTLTDSAAFDQLSAEYFGDIGADEPETMEAGA